MRHYLGRANEAVLKPAEGDEMYYTGDDDVIVTLPRNPDAPKMRPAQKVRRLMGRGGR